MEVGHFGYFGRSSPEEGHQILIALSRPIRPSVRVIAISRDCTRGILPSSRRNTQNLGPRRPATWRTIRETFEYWTVIFYRSSRPITLLETAPPLLYDRKTTSEIPSELPRLHHVCQRRPQIRRHRVRV